MALFSHSFSFQFLLFVFSLSSYNFLVSLSPTLFLLFLIQDENGRWKMAEVEGSAKTYTCQIVMLAMGFLGPEKTILDQMELAKDPRGNIATPKGEYSTNIPGN